MFKNILIKNNKYLIRVLCKIKEQVVRAVCGDTFGTVVATLAKLFR